MKDSTERSAGFAFQKSNYQWLVAGLGLLAVGYILMSGGAAEDPTAFSEEIFNFSFIQCINFRVEVGLRKLIRSKLDDRLFFTYWSYNVQ